jgi:hypothetical protein
MSCNKKTQYICPAYSSYFIHNEKGRDELFSPFQTDSVSNGSGDFQGTNATDPNATEASSSKLLDSFWSNKSSVGSGSKYKPKEIKTSNNQTSGLLIATGKNKIRNNTDIEMKFVVAFSNVESDSIPSKETAKDTLK